MNDTEDSKKRKVNKLLAEITPFGSKKKIHAHCDPEILFLNKHSF